MSGLFKAIGKIFKSVFNVIKKVALPVLAIGAVVLTGGAALGLGLPSLAGIGAKLGLSTALQGVLATAGKSALIGAIGSAVTGGDILKGAATGFALGGALGGIGALTSKAGGVLNAAGGASNGLGAGATTGAGAANASLTVPQSVLTNAGGAANAGLTVPALGTAGTGAATAGLGAGSILTTPLSPAITAAAAGGAAPAATGGMLGSVLSPVKGVLGFANQNPIVAGMALQGLGAGLSAKAQADQAREERESIAKNYTSQGMFSLPNTQGQALPDAGSYFRGALGKQVYDPATGRIYAAG